MKKADGDEQAQMFYCTDVLFSFPSFSMAMRVIKQASLLRPMLGERVCFF